MGVLVQEVAHLEWLGNVPKFHNATTSVVRVLHVNDDIASDLTILWAWLITPGGLRLYSQRHSRRAYAIRGGTISYQTLCALLSFSHYMGRRLSVRGKGSWRRDFSIHLADCTFLIPPPRCQKRPFLTHCPGPSFFSGFQHAFLCQNPCQ